MSDRKYRVLLTGGTGLLGRALLASAPVEEVEIIALTHKSPLDEALLSPALEIQTLRGDLTQPQLGLEPARYRQLCSELDVIVHMAAITKFGAQTSAIMSVNTDGTSQIVELARESGARLVHVSTAYVDEGRLLLPPASEYEASKRAAEALVTALPSATIVRPSIIIGDSKTGWAGAYQGMHHVVGSLMNGSLPFLPTRPDYLCDFVAQDWVTDAIWGLVRRPVDLKELWVTAGESALRISEITQLSTSLGRQLGFCPDTIRFVPYETIERLFLPVFVKKLPPRIRRKFEADIKLSRYMNQVEALPSSEQLMQQLFHLPARVSQLLVLERSMLRWAADNGALPRRALNSERPSYPSPE